MGKVLDVLDPQHARDPDGVNQADEYAEVPSTSLLMQIGAEMIRINY